MKTINDINEFKEILNSNDKCLVKIGTTHCGQCKVVGNTIKSIEPSYPDICFIDVDAEECEEIIDMYNIRGIPVVLFIKDGEVFGRRQGILNQSDLQSLLIS